MTAGVWARFSHALNFAQVQDLAIRIREHLPRRPKQAASSSSSAATTLWRRRRIA